LKYEKQLRNLQLQAERRHQESEARDLLKKSAPPKQQAATAAENGFEFSTAPNGLQNGSAISEPERIATATQPQAR